MNTEIIKGNDFAQRPGEQVIVNVLFLTGTTTSFFPRARRRHSIRRLSIGERLKRSRLKNRLRTVVPLITMKLAAATDRPTVSNFVFNVFLLFLLQVSYFSSICACRIVDECREAMKNLAGWSLESIIQSIRDSRRLIWVSDIY